MKKRILVSCIALCSAVFAVMAQRSYTFNAAALNVDGLPNQEISAIVTTVNLNPDGKNEGGATEFCGILANSGWDIVGFSEDFNYHSYLAAAPASTYYNFGKHSGSITTNLTQAFTRAAIDGLGIAVAKRMSFTGDTSTGLQVQWEKEYGGSGLTTIGDNGADNMITKGFRMYTVTIAEGVAVDVYVLHMDANSPIVMTTGRTERTRISLLVKHSSSNLPTTSRLTTIIAPSSSWVIPTVVIPVNSWRLALSITSMKTLASPSKMHG